MKRIITIITAITLLVSVGVAQQMPQDNWRYDGLTFSAPDATKKLRCIAIGTGGVYVGLNDPATAIVQFQESGAFVRQFGTFTKILGLACDSAGNVYVLDRGVSKVRVFDQNGTFLRDWGGVGSGNGQFNISAATSETMIAVDKNNQIYVCDPGNTRVQVFDSTGTFLRKWGDPGSLPGQFQSGDPYRIATSPNGWVYVYCASNQPTLRVFGSDGAFIKSANSRFVQAVSNDGIVLDNSGLNLRFADATLTQIFTFPTPDNIVPLACAFNQRGDFFTIGQTYVTVFEREYSNVDNSLLPPAIPQPVVLAVVQRAGTGFLDVDYKVTDADSPTVTTAALAFLGGNNTLSDVVPMSTFVEGTEANIGANQATGVEKRISWNMPADWSVDFAQIQAEVLAKDNRNLLGIHWITIPASGGRPAVEVSRKPVADAELLNLWYWFIGTHLPRMTFANGKVSGTESLFSGQVLASGIATTTSGRHFAYRELGVRAITALEVARATSGSYGFTSVDGNSVVREAVVPSSSVYGWGLNNYGQIDVPVSAWGATKIAAGGAHSLALGNDGSVSGWGYNGNNRAQALDAAGRSQAAGAAIDIVAVAAQLERASVTLGGQNGAMRAMDHQFQQSLVVGVMDRAGTPGVKFDVEGSGYGFRVVKTIASTVAEQPSTCRMQRP